MSLCTKCTKAKDISTKKPGKIPEYSIAAGYDYGQNLEIAGLPELSFIEKLLISKNVTHMNMIKLKSISNNSGSISQRGLKGHTIAFPHDGTEKIVEHLNLPRTSICDSVVVNYYGNTSTFEQVRICLRTMKQFQISKSKVMKWLNFLKFIGNPHYQNVKIIDDGLSEVEYGANILNELIDDARMVDEDQMLFTENQLSESLHGYIYQLIIEVLVDEDENEFLMQSILLTERNGVLPNQNITSVELIKSINKSLEIVVDEIEDELFEDDQGEIPTIEVMENQKEAISEFTDNDTLIYGSFPTLFPFGRGLRGINIFFKFRSRICTISS